MNYIDEITKRIKDKDRETLELLLLRCIVKLIESEDISYYYAEKGNFRIYWNTTGESIFRGDY